MNVYCIENKLDGKKYIGITKSKIEIRFKQHKTISRTKNSSNKSHLHDAMAKYGIDNFTVYKLDEASNKKELFEKEKYWIKQLNTKNNGYNETDGGEGTFGWKPSEEQKKQNSEKLKKYFENNPKAKEHLSNKSKEHWNKLSEDEQIKKRNQFLEARNLTSGSKGKTWKLSDETKQKMSESKKGYIMSDETKQKLSNIAKNRVGRKHSPETIEKMKQSAILRHQKTKI